MGLRLLVFADLHLSASGSLRPFERPDLSALDVDAAVTVGDVIDDNVDHAGREAGAPYERRGRAFFEHLDDAGVPVVAVPGNHDPVATTRRLADGLEDVHVAHRRAVTAEALGPAFEGTPLVGVGCEGFDVSMAFPYTEFHAIDPRTNTDEKTIAYVADDAADQVEAAVGRHLEGELGVDGVADALGIHGSERGRLADALADLREEYEALVDPLASVDGSPILFSHVAPFNTGVDYHHSYDGVDGRVHRGSVALKMAAARTAPLVTVSGHVHQQGHDVLETVAGDRVAYSPGSPGVALLEVDPEQRTVGVEDDLI